MTREETERLLKSEIDKLLRGIVKNNEKCQKCIFHHPEFGEGVCFMAFECIQQNFKAFTEEPARTQ